MAATVTDLAIAPVKGLQVSRPEWLDIGPAGPAGDRAFLVVEADGRLLLTSRTPRLLEVAASWDGEQLTLRFPQGTEVTAAPEPGARGETALYNDRRVAGRLVDGRLAAALSDHLGRPVRLLAREPADTGADDSPVTLMSTASLAAVV